VGESDSDVGCKKKKDASSPTIEGGSKASQLSSSVSGDIREQIKSSVAIGRSILDLASQVSVNQVQLLNGTEKDLPESLIEHIEDYSVRIEEIFSSNIVSSTTLEDNELIQNLHDLNVIHAEIIALMGSYLESLKIERHGLFNRLTAVVAYLEQGLPPGLRNRRPR